MVYQIKNTECNAILVEPPLLQTLLEAAEKSEFSTDRIFLFSDRELKPIKGIKDWRSFLPSASEAESWKWHSMNPMESKSTVAALNYSSGTVSHVIQVLDWKPSLTPIFRQAYQKAS